MHDLNPNYPDFPLLDRPGIWITGRAFASRGSWGTSDSDDYQFSDGIDYVRGAHDFKFGGEYRNATLSSVSGNNNQGVFWGNGSVTGNPLADFMLGKPLAIISIPSTISRYQHTVAGYVQDDYKVSRRLVLNLGLRYQVAPLWTPTTEYKLSDGTLTTGLATWRPGEQSRLFPTAPPGVVYAGDPGIPQMAVLLIGPIGLPALVSLGMCSALGKLVCEPALASLTRCRLPVIAPSATLVYLSAPIRR